MPTSDVFKKTQERDKLTYAIIGGGISFTFSSGTYEQRDAELMAVARAKSLQCHLYCKDENGAIYEIYPEKRRIERNKKTFEYKAYPEMMGNEPFVPGIQVGSY